MTNNERTTKALRTCDGTIKWYDPMKGFGFVTPDDGGPDILIRSSAVKALGRPTLPEGCRVTVLTEDGPQGRRALEILSLREDGDAEAPPPPRETTEGPREFEATLSSHLLLPARVKWFDRVKGYGFLNVFGVAEDVFVHMEVVRQWGIQTLMDGEAVACRIQQGERGLTAREIRPWEDAVLAQYRSGGNATRLGSTLPHRSQASPWDR
ncbi:MAG: cold shock domain-containing protein [Pseudomonadota bacterium]